jgi:hypothetical protein
LSIFRKALSVLLLTVILLCIALTLACGASYLSDTYNYGDHQSLKNDLTLSATGPAITSTGLALDDNAVPLSSESASVYRGNSMAGNLPGSSDEILDWVRERDSVFDYIADMLKYQAAWGFDLVTFIFWGIITTFTFISVNMIVKRVPEFRSYILLIFAIPGTVVLIMLFIFASLRGDYYNNIGSTSSYENYMVLNMFSLILFSIMLFFISMYFYRLYRNLNVITAAISIMLSSIVAYFLLTPVAFSTLAVAFFIFDVHISYFSNKSLFNYSIILSIEAWILMLLTPIVFSLILRYIKYITEKDTPELSGTVKKE